MRGLGSQYQYSALAQEFAGAFWVCGRTHGRQYLHDQPDVNQTDLLLVLGWNGMQSHQIPQAPRQLQRLSKDPDKLLIVVDPRLSETAKIADIHLPIRPGTDALLLKAMIAIILQEGWENNVYINNHTSGLEQVISLFRNFDTRSAVKTCRLDLIRCVRLAVFMPPVNHPCAMIWAFLWDDTAVCHLILSSFFRPYAEGSALPAAMLSTAT